MFHIQVEDKLFGEDWIKCFAAKILDAKYERTVIVEVVKGLTYLNLHQKADLLQVNQENNQMLMENLAFIHTNRYRLIFDPNAKPVHSRQYPVL